MLGSSWIVGAERCGFNSRRHSHDPWTPGLDFEFAICSVGDMELLFKVVEVAPSGDRLIAAADNLTVARAAFDTAVALWPTAAIELRQKARVILKSGGT
jgi:hypothetical protein